MFAVAPHTQQALTSATKAVITDHHLMDDLTFTEADQDEGKKGDTQPEGPNSTVLSYLQTVVAASSSAQEEASSSVLTVSVMDVLADFNRHGGAGVYRRASVLAFMKPFIATRAVELAEKDSVLLIHPRRVAEQISGLGLS